MTDDLAKRVAEQFAREASEEDVDEFEEMFGLNSDEEQSRRDAMRKRIEEAVSLS